VKKLVPFLFSLASLVFLLVLFNNKWGDLPPLGKFLDPFQGFWQNAENVSHKKDGALNLPGLKDEVKVYFDDRMMPLVANGNTNPRCRRPAKRSGG
jgi:penicillin amidase